MRYVLGFSMLMALLTTPARLKGEGFTVVNNCPKFTVVNNTPKVKITTTCGCGLTGDCTCWASQCSCSACGRSGVAAQAPKALSGTSRTVARDAAISPRPEPERGSSSGSLQPGMSIDVPAAKSGSIEYALPLSAGGCPGGNCPSASYSRGSIFIRRR